MTNRRKHRRVTIKSVGEFRRVDGGEKFKAFVGGISLGGLEFYSEEAVKTGTMLKISLFFMDTEGNELSENLKGEVRWFAPFRESFIAGVQFSEIVSKENYPRLFDYIKKSEEYFN